MVIPILFLSGFLLAKRRGSISGSMRLAAWGVARGGIRLVSGEGRRPSS